MKIWSIIIICLGLRLIGINQSLWLDEAISANVVKNYSYNQIIKKFSPSDFHPPGYYLMLKTWTSIFGYSEISLRMPSVIFSLITIYIVYLLAGVWPAVLTGLNPLLLYYSQEVRMYSMVTMLLTLALYFLIKKKYWWYSLMAFLSFVTFYGSVFMMVAVGLFLLYKKQYKQFLITSSGVVLAVAAMSPLLKMQMENSQEMLLTVKNWSLVLGKANLKNLLLIPIKFTSGRISFEPKIVYYLISGTFALYVFKPLAPWALPLKKGSLKNIRLYDFIFWMTLFIGTIFSIFTPMLQYFRFLYLIPVMALIIGKNKMITAGFLIFSLIYLLNPIFYREDWKNVSKNIGDRVYMIDSFGDPVKYYRPEVMINDIRETIYEKRYTGKDKRGKINDEREIITVIPYGEEIHGADHQQILQNQGYKLVKQNNFRGITIENWQKF